MLTVNVTGPKQRIGLSGGAAVYTHLKMLCKALACMDHDVWEECPTTTNAVERRNQDCSLAKPLHPKLAMIEAYKLDMLQVYCCR